MEAERLVIEDGPTGPRMTRCHGCKQAELRDAARDLSRDLDGHLFIAAVPAQVCGACGEVTHALDDLARFDTAVTRALVAVGARGPEAARWLRKAAGLRAAELADLLGVTPETVSRWETGKHPMDRATAFTLGALASAGPAERAAAVDRLRALGAAA
ncbi:MAG: helix-turn-helix domain-containing protein [Deltaproteobacteria bacterium]|nr:helix-turn-helix domain-containing protein [Deltaproteobacteria bacterium]